jgi:isopentenyl-diphosphate delta-isomerase
MNENEFVVLLDDSGRQIGTAPKSEVHDTETALHLAFSCHVVDTEGRVLVTRRALEKKTWPGVWTNSFCGHPHPGESIEAAVHRRAGFELGLAVTDLELALPDFRYRAVDASGIVENEICPVYTAVSLGEPQPDPSEVVDYRWVDPLDLAAAVASTPWAFSPWLVLQAPELRLFGFAREGRRVS